MANSSETALLREKLSESADERSLFYFFLNLFSLFNFIGWINDENPLEKAMKSMIDRDFQTPLDEEDAAARVLDPIINTYRQLAEGKTDINIPYGRLFKDYRTCNW